MVKQTQRPVKPTETSELFLVRGTLPNAARFSNCATIHKVVFGIKSEAVGILKDVIVGPFEGPNISGYASAASRPAPRPRLLTFVPLELKNRVKNQRSK